MNCQHCQEEIPVEYKFCPSCGQPVSAPPPQQNQSYPPPQDYGQQAPQGFGQQAPQGFGQQAPLGYGQQAPQGFREQAPQGYGQQAPRAGGFGQRERLERLPPAPQPVIQQSFNPLFVVIPVVLLLALFFAFLATSYFPQLFAIQDVQTSTYKAFPSLTVEEMLSHCSTGDWSAEKDDETWLVTYEGTFLGTNETISVVYDRETRDTTEMSFGITTVYGDTAVLFEHYLATEINDRKTQGEMISLQFSSTDLFSFYMKEELVTQEIDVTYGDVIDYFFQDIKWGMAGETEDGDCMLRWTANSIDGDETSFVFELYLSRKTYNPVGGTQGGEIFTDKDMMDLAYIVNTAIENGISSDMFQEEWLNSLSAEEIQALYTDLAQKYKENELTTTVDQCVEMGLAWALPYVGADNLQAAYYDFDENGIPELVISQKDGTELAIHTLSKESGTYEAVLLFTASEHEKIETSMGGYIAVTNYAGFQEASVVYELLGGIPQEIDPSSIERWFVPSYDYFPLSNLIYDEQSDDGENSYSTQSFSELDFYESIIGEYGFSYLFGWEHGSFDNEIVNSVFRWVDFYDFGTCFYDIDGNGVKELFVGSKSDPEIFYDLYTIVVEAESPYVVKLSDGGERYRYSMDSNTNLIYYNWSHSADDSGVDTYLMNGSELTWQERLSTDKMMNYDSNLYSFPYEGIETYLIFP